MDLIERLRAVKWEETDDCDRMPDDPAHKCVFVDMRPDDFRALLREAADALEAAREDAAEAKQNGYELGLLAAAREDGWQPIETAPKPDIGANGFGGRLLLVVDCGDGTIPSVRRGYWAGTDWYLDCCNGLATACGYRVTHWRPLPAPPAIDQAMKEQA